MSWNSLIFYHWCLIPYSVSVIPFLHSHEIRYRDPGNEEWTGSQPRNVIRAFRERTWRTIAIFRGNSSNASFLRSAALGKRCILHIECFIKSAWLWHLIRSSCWGMRKLTSCAHSCQLVVKLVPLLLTLEYPATYLNLFEWQVCSLLFLGQV